MKTVIDKNKVQHVLKQIISLSDVATISQALKEIEQDKILQPWRTLPKAKKYPKQKTVSCRDGLMHKEIIKIVNCFNVVNYTETPPIKVPDYYTYVFGCHSRYLRQIFRNFIENNECQILLLPGLQYTAGKKFDYSLRFDSEKAAQYFCDLVLNSNCYQMI